MAPSPLIAQLPPHVRFARHDLPDAENALVDWRRANEAVYTAPELGMPLFTRLYYGDDETCEVVHIPVAGSDRALLDDYLRRNKPSHALLTSASTKPRMQWAVSSEDPGAALNISCFGGDRSTCMVSHLRYRRALEDGDLDSAIDEARLNMRLAMLALRGEGDELTTMCALMQWGRALGMYRILAVYPRSPQQLLEELRKEIALFPDVQAIARNAIRIELCYDVLPTVEALAAIDDLESLLAAIEQKFSLLSIGQYGSILDLDAPDGEWRAPYDAAIKRRSAELIGLLEGHPRPFDGVKTAQRLGALAHRRVQRLDMTGRAMAQHFQRSRWNRWSNTLRRAFSRDDCWPEGYFPAIPLGYLTEREFQSVRVLVGPLDTIFDDARQLSHRLGLPLQPGAFRRSRRRVLAHPNPLGHALATQLMDSRALERTLALARERWLAACNAFAERLGA